MSDGAAADQVGFSRTAQGVLVLTGAITYDNAAAVMQAAGPHAGVKGDAVDLDLSGLSNADSATLAVLIAWAAQARTRGVTLRYLNAPQTLNNLARLSDVATLLGFNPAH